MTLLEECKELVKRDILRGWIAPQDLIDAILRHEHDDWKGPWKCEKCGHIYDYTCHPDECTFPHPEFDRNPSRRLIPYERRKAERRKA